MLNNHLNGDTGKWAFVKTRLGDIVCYILPFDYREGTATMPVKRPLKLVNHIGSIADMVLFFQNKQHRGTVTGNS